jgi:hypothetical protein
MWKESSNQQTLTEGEISTVDLLVLTGLDMLLFIENIIYFFKTSCLNKEVNGTEPSL